MSNFPIGCFASTEDLVLRFSKRVAGELYKDIVAIYPAYIAFDVIPSLIASKRDNYKVYKEGISSDYYFLVFTEFEKASDFYFSVEKYQNISCWQIKDGNLLRTNRIERKKNGEGI
jgi:hypothetical protein